MQDSLNVKGYLETVLNRHSEEKIVYTVSNDAKEEFISCRDYLDKLEVQANNGYK